VNRGLTEFPKERYKQETAHTPFIEESIVNAFTKQVQYQHPTSTRNRMIQDCEQSCNRACSSSFASLSFLLLLPLLLLPLLLNIVVSLIIL
jgi:hypothetical protein